MSAGGLLLLGAPALAAGVAPTALPTGAVVAAGQASLSQNGNRLTVTQGSDRAILNWNTFNIGSAASVNFIQPGATSAALNRVMSNDPSALLGTLSANGQV
ncbi:MAG: filamentous hemagglutinin N-terminal domain-containing protein, partial [Rhodoferax sp.]|nr:filamentous hemagglutinin N-terminal domain-containing protein [Rhodoferax sp.]